ncbi:TetR/AcrR family transcriptional regulator [Paludibacterium yongneupense]|uniref:TetR/AcrR family transcriptional regulator n=1 Tax=Paludibacterium yongneupense TaxID=400061 RepID=UPI000418CF3E|nr:TetR/AcrR family transcriptional regulator [Paludibacterium yongneupense]
MQNDLPPLPAGASARERILLTAHALFYRDGIRATGIDRIIAQASVTKVTLYRHFPSKDDLVLAFLEYRHRQWMEWFAAALSRNGGDIGALVPTLGEWFADEGFRGCAFINSAAEVGASLPGAAAICRRHKQEMTAWLATLLPPQEGLDASAIAQAVDGAIVRAQCGDPDLALRALSRTVAALTGGQAVQCLSAGEPAVHRPGHAS